MKSLGKWFPDLSPIPESSLEFTAIDATGGDMVRMLGLPTGNVVDKTQRANLNDFITKWEEVHGDDLPNKKLSFRLDAGNKGPRALIFRDSFSTVLLTFLSIHFSHITALWGHGWFSSEIVEKEKPDVVIYEIVERYLINGPGMLGDTNHLLKSLYNVTPATRLPHISGENILDATVPEGAVRYAKYGSTPRGIIMYGPYVTLKQGEYRAVFRLKSNGKADGPIVTVKVTAEKGRKTLGSKTLGGSDFVPGRWSNFNVDIKAGADDEKDVEFVADYSGGADVYIESAWFEKTGAKPLDIYDVAPSASAKTAALP